MQKMPKKTFVSIASLQMLLPFEPEALLFLIKKSV